MVIQQTALIAIFRPHGQHSDPSASTALSRNKIVELMLEGHSTCERPLPDQVKQRMDSF